MPSLRMWNVFYVLLCVKFWFIRFTNNSILFLFIFHIVLQLFWNWACRSADIVVLKILWSKLKHWFNWAVPLLFVDITSWIQHDISRCYLSYKGRIQWVYLSSMINLNFIWWQLSCYTMNTTATLHQSA